MPQPVVPAVAISNSSPRLAPTSLMATLYYYLQNEKFNANDYFFNKEGIDRPKARRNEGGFTIGGPIVKDRFFFFGGYQYTNAITGFVPTARSTSVTPLALTLLGNDRSAAAIATAFNQARDQFRALSESSSGLRRQSSAGRLFDGG